MPALEYDTSQVNVSEEKKLYKSDVKQATVEISSIKRTTKSRACKAQRKQAIEWVAKMNFLSELFNQLN